MKKRSSQLKESQRMIEADKYREGFQDGYRIGLKEGRLRHVCEVCLGAGTFPAGAICPSCNGEGRLN